MAVIVASGVRADGVRAVRGLAVGLSEAVALGRSFFQSLVARGLRGVPFVVSDAPAGLKQAIAEVFGGAAWQRCRGHFRRNLRARVPKTAQAMVAVAVRPIFQQVDRGAAPRQLREGCRTLEGTFPQAVALRVDAEEEICTFYDFPAEPRRQLDRTNPLERSNTELQRRSAVVGILKLLRIGGHPNAWGEFPEGSPRAQEPSPVPARIPRRSRAPSPRRRAHP